MLTENYLDDLLSSCLVDYQTIVLDAFIYNPHTKQILIQKRSADRSEFPNQWDAFGGHLEEGETIKDGLAREVLEESSMQLNSIDSLVHEFEWDENEETYNLQFLCQAKGNVKLEDGKATEYRWVRKEDVPLIIPDLSKEMANGLYKAFAALK